MLTSLIKVQSRIPNIGPENTSQWERKTAVSFRGYCTTSPLSMASLTPYCCPYNMGLWSCGGKENVPFLTFWPKQRHKNLSVHSAPHSQGRAGVSKPCCGKVWGHQKQARRPRALASVSHLSRLYSVFGKAASLLKKVGEPLLWSIMHVHVDGNHEKQQRKMNATCLLLVYLRYFQYFKSLPREKTHSFLYMFVCFF